MPSSPMLIAASGPTDAGQRGRRGLDRGRADPGRQGGPRRSPSARRRRPGHRPARSAASISRVRSSAEPTTPDSTMSAPRRAMPNGAGAGGRSRTARRPATGAGPASGTVAIRIPVTPCTASTARWLVGRVDAADRGVPAGQHQPGPGEAGGGQRLPAGPGELVLDLRPGPELGQPGQHGRDQHGGAEQRQPRRSAGSISSTVGHGPSQSGVRAVRGSRSAREERWMRPPTHQSQRWSTEQVSPVHTCPLCVTGESSTNQITPGWRPGYGVAERSPERADR